MVDPTDEQALLEGFGSLLRRRDSELLRLTFGVGQSAAPLDLEPLIGPLGRFLESGLIRRTGDGHVESTLKYEFLGDLLLASDRREHPYRVDHVLGVTWAAQLAAACLPRHRARSALDVGCGNGVLALHLARQAGSVAAVDISPRAVAATRLNATLNGVGNVEALRSDLFSAVAHRTFDLVVANPPYVISPEHTLLYRDSNRQGDDISRAAVAGAASVLAEDGIAVILVEWADGPVRTWDRPRRWVESTGCAGWILSYANTDATTYTDQWLEVPERQDNHKARRARWLDHLEALGAESVTSGVIVLQRQDATAPWIHATDLVADPTRDLGSQIVSGIRNQQLAAQGRLDSVLDRNFDLSAGAAIHEGAELRTNLGAVTLSDPEARIVGALLGGATLHGAITAAGSTIRAATPGMLRLIRCGAIEPIG